MTILEEAQGLISNDRQADYGNPIDSFSNIAKEWNLHLAGKILTPLTEEDVAIMMVRLKLVRQKNKPKRDNLVDACGYLGLVEIIQKTREERGENK